MGLFVTQHITDLITKMHLLQKAGDLCDLTLTSSSGNEVKVHRLVLECCCTEIVKKKISRNLNQLNLLNISTEMLESMVHFMYTGEIQLDRGSITDTVYAYQELGLKPALEKLTSDGPSVSSAGLGPSLDSQEVHPYTKTLQQARRNVEEKRKGR